MSPDKTTLGISEELRQYIEALVEEVVLEDKPFENHKKYLRRFCEAEGIDSKYLETILSDFFETIEELKSRESKRNERLALILGKECYLSDKIMAQILSSINKQRWEREEEAKRIEKEEAERKAREEAERKAREEAERKKDKAPKGVTAIDLGLPSGTKWASCNVGATKPWEFGGYYAWGETEEKRVYNWEAYDRSAEKSNSICGTTYDVAHVKWGGIWKIPTMDQIKELIDNCEIEWTTLKYVNGSRFTSKINGNSIFLPAAGSRFNKDLNKPGVYGDYWSASNGNPIGSFAYRLFFNSSNVSEWFDNRHEGLSVRPVATE